jgi:TetR/AcrR family transcriptional repressor of nem operon
MRLDSAVKEKMARPATDTRRRLVEAAMYLFWEHGYANTGMAAILERARANSGSFYYFFNSKTELLYAVLDEYAGNFEAVILRPVFEQTGDPLKRIFAILAGYRARLTGTQCTYGCPIGRLALEIEPFESVALQKIATNFDAWTAAIYELLRDMQHDLPSGTKLPELAQFVLAIMEGGVMMARAHRSVGPFDASVRQLRNYFAVLKAARQGATSR